MDLRKLQHAVTLAKEKHFASAAEKLFITPSALSQSITRLENDIGFPIFDRNRNGAVTTSRGKEFLSMAEALLGHARRLEYETALLGSLNTRSVSFGFGPIPASILLKPVLQHLAQSAPLLSCNVKVELPHEALIKALTSEEMEFYVAARQALKDSDGLTIKPFLKLKIGLFIRSNHPLAGKQSVNYEETLKFRLLTTRISKIYGSSIQNRHGFNIEQPWQSAFNCDDLSVLRDLALQTDSILAAPDLLVHDDCRDKKFIALKTNQKTKFKILKSDRFFEFQDSVDICFISLSNRTLSSAAMKTIACIEQVAQNLEASKKV